MNYGSWHYFVVAAEIKVLRDNDAKQQRILMCSVRARLVNQYHVSCGIKKALKPKCLCRGGSPSSLYKRVRGWASGRSLPV